MDLEFTFRNVEPTEAIKAWANKRFQKVTKHLKDPSSAHIELSVDKHRHRAELTVHSHGDILRASDETDDLYTTLDQVMQKLEAAAQRQKDRTTVTR
ncbi:MAG: ribosome-associated translation inhibitor RaiA [Pseudomonadota bacterium]|nr:ribosome-associated translation inhibitor RaiA [Pseudomonadota bacterium]